MMTSAQREALVAVRTPEDPDERIAQVRANLERAALGDVVAAAAMLHRVEVDDILSRSMRLRVVAARHELWRVLHARGSWSYPELARLFSVTHSSIHNAVNGKPSRRLEAGR